MVDEKNENIQWTPELERRYQYVQKQYDNARTLGMDVLKILLGTVIALNVIPMIFNQKILVLFPGKWIVFIYVSWICILLSILFGSLAYFLIFEGYYHFAHFEAIRWLSGSLENMRKFETKSNCMFDCAHWLGIIGIFLFSMSIICIVIAIVGKMLIH